MSLYQNTQVVIVESTMDLNERIVRRCTPARAFVEFEAMVLLYQQDGHEVVEQTQDSVTFQHGNITFDLSIDWEVDTPTVENDSRMYRKAQAIANGEW